MSPITSILISFFTECIRNMVGFFLVIVGIIIICLGAKWHMDDLIKLGTLTLIPAAMLALQSKRTPEGNTTTTQTTVPIPAMVAPADQSTIIPKQ